MKLVIIAGIIAFIAFSIWYAKRKGVTAEYQPKSTELDIQTNLDKPVDFGYKSMWIAVKTDKKEELVTILGLKNGRPANWKSGMASADGNIVFITPQIGEWTLVVGWGLPVGDSPETMEQLEILLNKLSSTFGEAQFFGSYRVSDFYNWTKSVNGKIERVYSYLGEQGENIKVFGKPTEAEAGLNLFNSLSKEAESNAYWDNEDWDSPDEELVLKIAENWSINPIKLTERTDVKKELGTVGTFLTEKK